MRAIVALILLSSVAACAQGTPAHGYKNVSGQPRTQADLDQATAECDYEQQKMLALAGPLAAGPNLRESCMRSKGWLLVERLMVR